MTVLIFVFLCLLGEIIFLYLSFYHAAFIICWMVISTVSTDYSVNFFAQWAVFGGMGTCTFDTFCLFVEIVLSMSISLAPRALRYFSISSWWFYVDFGIAYD